VVKQITEGPLVIFNSVHVMDWYETTGMEEGLKLETCHSGISISTSRRLYITVWLDVFECMIVVDYA
jgi:hypothetical protein